MRRVAGGLKLYIIDLSLCVRCAAASVRSGRIPVVVAAADVICHVRHPVTSLPPAHCCSLPPVQDDSRRLCHQPPRTTYLNPGLYQSTRPKVDLFPRVTVKVRDVADIRLYPVPVLDSQETG